MFSLRVGPEAPNASVGAGAGARTPNVKTPDTTCPSPESACQRTVYGPFRNRGRTAVKRRPSLRTLTTRTLPDDEYTRTEPGTRLHVLVVEQRDRARRRRDALLESR